MADHRDLAVSSAHYKKGPRDLKAAQMSCSSRTCQSSEFPDHHRREARRQHEGRLVCGDRGRSDKTPMPTRPVPSDTDHQSRGSDVSCNRCLSSSTWSGSRVCMCCSRGTSAFCGLETSKPAWRHDGQTGPTAEHDQLTSLGKSEVSTIPVTSRCVGKPRSQLTSRRFEVHSPVMQCERTTSTPCSDTRSRRPWPGHTAVDVHHEGSSPENAACSVTLHSEAAASQAAFKKKSEVSKVERFSEVVESDPETSSPAYVFCGCKDCTGNEKLTRSPSGQKASYAGRSRLEMGNSHRNSMEKMLQVMPLMTTGNESHVKLTQSILPKIVTHLPDQPTLASQLQRSPKFSGRRDPTKLHAEAAMKRHTKAVLSPAGRPRCVTCRCSRLTYETVASLLRKISPADLSNSLRPRTAARAIEKAKVLARADCRSRTRENAPTYTELTPSTVHVLTSREEEPEEGALQGKLDDRVTSCQNALQQTEPALVFPLPESLFRNRASMGQPVSAQMWGSSIMPVPYASPPTTERAPSFYSLEDDIDCQSKDSNMQEFGSTTEAPEVRPRSHPNRRSLLSAATTDWTTYKKELTPGDDITRREPCLRDHRGADRVSSRRKTRRNIRKGDKGQNLSDLTPHKAVLEDRRRALQRTRTRGTSSGSSTESLACKRHVTPVESGVRCKSTMTDGSSALGGRRQRDRNQKSRIGDRPHDSKRRRKRLLHHSSVSSTPSKRRCHSHRKRNCTSSESWTDTDSSFHGNNLGRRGQRRKEHRNARRERHSLAASCSGTDAGSSTDDDCLQNAGELSRRSHVRKRKRNSKSTDNDVLYDATQSSQRSGVFERNRGGLSADYDLSYHATQPSRRSHDHERNRGGPSADYDGSYHATQPSRPSHEHIRQRDMSSASSELFRERGHMGEQNKGGELDEFRVRNCSSCDSRHSKSSLRHKTDRTRRKTHDGSCREFKFETTERSFTSKTSSDSDSLQRETRHYDKFLWQKKSKSTHQNAVNSSSSLQYEEQTSSWKIHLNESMGNRTLSQSTQIRRRLSDPREKRLPRKADAASQSGKHVTGQWRNPTTRRRLSAVAASPLRESTPTHLPRGSRDTRVSREVGVISTRAGQHRHRPNSPHREIKNSKAGKVDLVQRNCKKSLPDSLRTESQNSIIEKKVYIKKCDSSTPMTRRKSKKDIPKDVKYRGKPSRRLSETSLFKGKSDARSSQGTKVESEKSREKHVQRSRSEYSVGSTQHGSPPHTLRRTCKKTTEDSRNKRKPSHVSSDTSVLDAKTKNRKGKVVSSEKSRKMRVQRSSPELSAGSKDYDSQAHTVQRKFKNNIAEDARKRKKPSHVSSDTSVLDAKTKSRKGKVVPSEKSREGRVQRLSPELSAGSKDYDSQTHKVRRTFTNNTAEDARKRKKRCRFSSDTSLVDVKAKSTSERGVQTEKQRKAIVKRSGPEISVGSQSSSTSSKQDCVSPANAGPVSRSEKVRKSAAKVPQDAEESTEEDSFQRKDSETNEESSNTPDQKPLLGQLNTTTTKKNLNASVFEENEFESAWMRQVARTDPLNSASENNEQNKERIRKRTVQVNTMVATKNNDFKREKRRRGKQKVDGYDDGRKAEKAEQVNISHTPEYTIHDAKQIKGSSAKYHGMWPTESEFKSRKPGRGKQESKSAPDEAAAADAWRTFHGKERQVVPTGPSLSQSQPPEHRDNLRQYSFPLVRGGVPVTGGTGRKRGRTADSTVQVQNTCKRSKGKQHRSQRLPSATDTEREIALGRRGILKYHNHKEAFRNPFAVTDRSKVEEASDDVLRGLGDRVQWKERDARKKEVPTAPFPCCTRRSPRYDLCPICCSEKSGRARGGLPHVSRDFLGGVVPSRNFSRYPGPHCCVQLGSARPLTRTCASSPTRVISLCRNHAWKDIPTLAGNQISRFPAIATPCTCSGCVARGYQPSGEMRSTSASRRKQRSESNDRSIRHCAMCQRKWRKNGRNWRKEEESRDSDIPANSCVGATREKRTAAQSMRRGKVDAVSPDREPMTEYRHMCPHCHGKVLSPKLPFLTDLPPSLTRWSPGITDLSRSRYPRQLTPIADHVCERTFREMNGQKRISLQTAPGRHKLIPLSRVCPVTLLPARRRRDRSAAPTPHMRIRAGKGSLPYSTSGSRASSRRRQQSRKLYEFSSSSSDSSLSSEESRDKQHNALCAACKSAGRQGHGRRHRKGILHLPSTRPGARMPPRGRACTPAESGSQQSGRRRRRVSFSPTTEEVPSRCSSDQDQIPSASSSDQDQIPSVSSSDQDHTAAWAGRGKQAMPWPGGLWDSSSQTKPALGELCVMTDEAVQTGPRHRLPPVLVDDIIGVALLHSKGKAGRTRKRSFRGVPAQQQSLASKSEGSVVSTLERDRWQDWDEPQAVKAGHPQKRRSKTSFPDSSETSSENAGLKFQPEDESMEVRTFQPRSPIRDARVLSSVKTERGRSRKIEKNRSLKEELPLEPSPDSSVHESFQTAHPHQHPDVKETVRVQHQSPNTRRKRGLTRSSRGNVTVTFTTPFEDESSRTRFAQSIDSAAPCDRSQTQPRRRPFHTENYRQFPSDCYTTEPVQSETGSGHLRNLLRKISLQARHVTGSSHLNGVEDSSLGNAIHGLHRDEKLLDSENRRYLHRKPGDRSVDKSVETEFSECASQECSRKDYPRTETLRSRRPAPPHVSIYSEKASQVDLVGGPLREILKHSPDRPNTKHVLFVEKCAQTEHASLFSNYKSPWKSVGNSSPRTSSPRSRVWTKRQAESPNDKRESMSRLSEADSAALSSDGNQDTGPSEGTSTRKGGRSGRARRDAGRRSRRGGLPGGAPPPRAEPRVARRSGTRSQHRRNSARKRLRLPKDCYEVRMGEWDDRFLFGRSEPGKSP